MAWSKRVSFYLLLTVIFSSISSCSVSYKLNSASIDYSTIKSISIKDFPNMALLVYAPLSQRFSESLRDRYIRQTRLEVLRENGTLDLEGEITGYDLSSTAVTKDAWASKTRLTLTVKVRYTNQVDQTKDFEQSFSAYREFDASETLESRQDELCDALIKEIVDQIYNETVANW